MKTKCDWCGQSVKKVGRLNRVYASGKTYLYLCKSCKQDPATTAMIKHLFEVRR